MNPIIHHDLMQARITDLHCQAYRDAQARAASQACRTRTPQRTHRVRGLTALMARRVRTALGGTAGEGTAGRDAIQYLEPPDMRYQFH
jgi:hypothetical protein